MRVLPFLLALVAGPLTLAAQDAAVARAVSVITPEIVAHRVHTLAHDSMAGRDTPSPELEQAAAWIAAEFRRFGLAPGGDDGTFIQRYPIQRIRLDLAGSRVAVRGGPTWRLGTDLLHIGGGRRVEASERVVVVAGQPTPQALREANLAGAIVFVMTPTTPEGRLAGPAQQILFATMQQSPALVVGVADVADSVWARFGRGQDRVTLTIPWGRGEVPPMLLTRPQTVRQVLGQRGLTLDALRGQMGRPLTVHAPDGFVASAVIREEVVEEVRVPNVVGVLEGSDPVLKQEYLVYSAHMDHVGVAGRGTGCTAMGADSVCNGADDNASGRPAS
jgi:hypothetical protein